MEHNSDVLTRNAKSAIRHYMITLVAIPSIVVTMIGFLMGFFIDKAATSKAYENAYSSIQGEVVALVNSVATSAANASRSADEANRAATELKELIAETKLLSKEVEALKEKLVTLSGIDHKLTSDITSKLLERSDFLESVTGQFGTRLDDVERAIRYTSIQSGTIEMKAVGTRPLRDGSKCKTGADNTRGTIKAFKKFDKAFEVVPSVTIALSNADVVGVLRLNVSISEVTKKGFTYSFITYCNTKVYGASAMWSAVATAG